MSYIGQAALKNSELKRFDVTSSTSATHVLSWQAPNEQSLFITINGVKQQDDSYTIAGDHNTIYLLLHLFYGLVGHTTSSESAVLAGRSRKS